MTKPASAAPARPDFAIERAAGAAGYVVGVDEVGRGPWAGPVYAAAVRLFDMDAPAELLGGLRDSKALSKRRREALAPLIARHARCALGVASVREIEDLNILQASLLAMRRAVDALAAEIGTPPALALVDGNRAPKLACGVETVVKGDAKSLSIAAASIFAKVSRDRHMATLAAQYPGYGWERNAGYGVREHRLGLQRLGVTIHHRRTFTPVSKFMTPEDS